MKKVTSAHRLQATKCISNRRFDPSSGQNGSVSVQTLLFSLKQLRKEMFSAGRSIKVFFTKMKVLIRHCKNTLLQVKVLH